MKSIRKTSTVLLAMAWTGTIFSMGAPSADAQDFVTEIVVPRGASWRYTYTEYSGWFEPGFDDSDWNTGNAPFEDLENTGSCSFQGVTDWDLETTLYLRTHFTVPGRPSDGTVRIAIDNDYKFWVNGELIGSATKENCAKYWNALRTVPASALQPGENTIAFEAIDRGAQNGFDLELEVTYDTHENEPPVADAGPDRVLRDGDDITLDGSRSTDPDGDIVKYEWDFTSDGTYDYVETPDSAPDGSFDGMVLLTWPHAYSEVGTYHATLRVTDEWYGYTDTDTCEIKVIKEIYIRYDGSITDHNHKLIPAPISKQGKVYTMTGDIRASIFIEESRMEFVGNGHKVLPPVDDYDGNGINVCQGANQVTISGVTVERFTRGIVIGYREPLELPWLTEGGRLIANQLSYNDSAIEISKADDYEVQGNMIRGEPGSQGILIQVASGCAIQDNGITGVRSNAISLSGSDLNVVEGNTIEIGEQPGELREFAILLDHSSMNTISSNLINDDPGSGGGIHLDDDSSDNSIINNTVSDCGGWCIGIHQGMRNVVYNNVVEPSPFEIPLYGGIIVGGKATDSLIIGNTIRGSEGTRGIVLLTSTGENRIEANRLMSNETGILVLRAKGQTIVGNYVGPRGWKAIALGGFGNRICANVIAGYLIGFDSGSSGNEIHLNTVFAFTEIGAGGGADEWSNPFGEGNHWYSYEGVDDGSDGRIPGDGIGDTELPHNGLDYNPLMERFGGLSPNYMKSAMSRTDVPEDDLDRFNRILDRAQRHMDAGRNPNAVRALESFNKLISEMYEYPEQALFTVGQVDHLIMVSNYIIDVLTYPPQW